MIFIPQTQIHTFNSELFLKEVDEYLSLYPHTQHIDICLHDLNGHIRGKRIDVKSLKKSIEWMLFSSFCLCHEP